MQHLTSRKMLTKSTDNYSEDIFMSTVILLKTYQPKNLPESNFRIKIKIKLGRKYLAIPNNEYVLS